MVRTPRWEKLEARLERLELDAETQDRVEAILEARREGKQALREELGAAREAFHELMTRGDADEASLLAQAELISRLRFEMQKERIATHLELREVLSGEQLAKLSARPGHEGCGKHRGGWRR